MMCYVKLSCCLIRQTNNTNNLPQLCHLSSTISSWHHHQFTSLKLPETVKPLPVSLNKTYFWMWWPSVYFQITGLTWTFQEYISGCPFFINSYKCTKCYASSYLTETWSIISTSIRHHDNAHSSCEDFWSFFLPYSYFLSSLNTYIMNSQF